MLDLHPVVAAVDVTVGAMVVGLVRTAEDVVVRDAWEDCGTDVAGEREGDVEVGTLRLLGLFVVVFVVGGMLSAGFPPVVVVAVVEVGSP